MKYHLGVSRLAVVLTLYNRLEYLDRQISELGAQRNQDFDLYICNNSGQDISFPGARVYNYFNKYKMYGRFYLIRDHIVNADYDMVLLVDDDEAFPPDLIDECYRQFDEDIVKSFWGFQTYQDYWVRDRLRGDWKGDYAGTGGLLSPIALWRVPEVYEAPEEYWIVDDLWLSYCILRYTDYLIMGLNVAITFYKDEGKKATYLSIKPLKSAFHKEYIMPYRRAIE